MIVSLVARLVGLVASIGFLLALIHGFVDSPLYRGGAPEAVAVIHAARATAATVAAPVAGYLRGEPLIGDLVVAMEASPLVSLGVWFVVLLLVGGRR